MFKGELSTAELIGESILVVRFNRPLRSMGTVVWGGGFKDKLRMAIFIRVDESFEHMEPTEYIADVLYKYKLPMMTSAAFLTAYDVRKFVYSTAYYEGITAEVYATMGFSEHPSCLERYEEGFSEWGVGTLNILVITDKQLSWTGFLDTYRLVCEAKSNLVASIGYSCPTSLACGTVSDAILLAAPIGTEAYGGFATRVGVAIVRALADAFRKAMYMMDLGDYLRYILGGLDPDILIDAALKAYGKAPVKGVSKRVFEEMFKEELEKALRDPNVIVAMRAMRFIDQVSNYIPGSDLRGRRIEAMRRLMGSSVAEYINGFRGLLGYYWIESLMSRLKRDLNFEAPPYTSEFIASLVGALMTRVYEKIEAGEKT